MRSMNAQTYSVFTQLNASGQIASVVKGTESGRALSSIGRQLEVAPAQAPSRVARPAAKAVAPLGVVYRGHRGARRHPG
jgi:hypothetical protein